MFVSQYRWFVALYYYWTKRGRVKKENWIVFKFSRQGILTNCFA
jgi:hypothetical protein